MDFFFFFSIYGLCLLHSFSCKKKIPRYSKHMVKRHPCFRLETTYHGWWDNPTRFISIIWEQRTRISKCLVFRQTSVFLQPEFFMQIMYLQFKLTVYWTWRSTEFPCFTLKFQYSQCDVVFIFCSFELFIIPERMTALRMFSSLESSLLKKKTESARFRFILRVCYYQCDTSIYAMLCRFCESERSLGPEWGVGI